ncbi:MAG: alpha-L-rhamnosidase N-terminal domain-containing protein, partial [Pirellulales bacterium]
MSFRTSLFHPYLLSVVAAGLIVFTGGAIVASDSVSQVGAEGRKIGTAALVAVCPRCEYLTNPLGIDSRRPRLTWELQSDETGQKQTAYRILVASTEEKLARNEADLWDSGKIQSSETAHVPYAGTPLKSGQRCYWTVRISDQSGRPSLFSQPAWWEMGLLDDSDWKGTWIAGPEPCPYFRKVFTAPRPVRSARLYICGQGVYEARLNGKALSDQVLGPQLSYYPERMLYDTFDVTSLVKQGKNAVAVWLAPGWFGGDRGREEQKVLKKPDGPGHALIAQLVVRYADGTEEIVGTDQGWKTELSPFEPVKSHWVHAFQGSGERFDAEKEPFGWDTPRFNDTAWADASEIKAPTKRLCARMIEPNRIVETVRPVAVSDIKGPLDRDGFAAMAEAAGARNWSLETMTNPTFARHWQPTFTRSYKEHGNSPVAGFEVDFGKHVSGWVRMDVTGKPGDTVTMFGLDQHHLCGRPGEQVGQLFMHRAFRYVPIHVSGKGQRPRIENIRAVAVQNDVRRTGRFECSNSTLNKVHDVSARTWAVHLLSGMPRDSWRERFGTALIETTESSFYWCDMGAFYTKWMTDHRDVQRPDGYLAMSGGPIAYDYWSPNWGKNGIVLVPWLMYLHYGDRQVIEENYPAMQRWLKLCVPKDDTGRTWQPPANHAHFEAGYGDHARPRARWYDSHTGDLFETLHTIDCFRMAEQMARALGKTVDAKWHRDIQTRLAAKCNRAEFLNRDKGLYGGGDQGCHALAVYLNIAPPQLREKVAQHLIHDIMETRAGHLDTGFLGTWYLLKTLTRLNRPDVALRVITNSEPPSFAAMLKHPDTVPEELTLLPEAVSGGMIPHPGWCSMGSWCYQALGGITPDPEHPGFARVIIRPQIVPELDWVKAEYDSIRGTIASHWTCDKGHCTLTVTIPPNTTGLLYVPTTDPKKIEAPSAPLAVFQRMEGSYALFELSSGTHRFESDL